MFYGPAELARLALVRADVVAADARVATRFEQETGQKSYVISGWRSFDEQDTTFAEGQAEGFRAAPKYESRHPYGAAIDRGIVGHVTTAEQDQKNPLYATLARIAREEGLKPGFDFKTGRPDPYHLEANEPLADSKAKWAALVKERLWRGSVVGAIVLAVAIFYGMKRKGKR